MNVSAVAAALAASALVIGVAGCGSNKSSSPSSTGVKAPLTPVNVGSRGNMAVGPAADGSKSVGLMMFTEGKAFVVLEFNGPPNDPVPADVVLDLARKQDAGIKAGTPS